LKTYVISEEKNKIEPFFNSKPNSFHVKRKKEKKKLNIIVSKHMTFQKRKRKLNLFFEKNNLGFF
jgi:hypothetical protein